MQAQQSGIHLRKEVLPQKYEKPEREQTKGKEEDDENATMFEGSLQQLFVAAAEVLKLALEAALEAAQEALGLSRCSCPRMMYITSVGIRVRDSK